MLDPTDQSRSPASKVFLLDTAEEAALHPRAATLAVLQHNGFSARMVRRAHALTETPLFLTPGCASADDASIVRQKASR